jgi:hypothetical protein
LLCELLVEAGGELALPEPLSLKPLEDTGLVARAGDTVATTGVLLAELTADRVSIAVGAAPAWCWVAARA